MWTECMKAEGFLERSHELHTLSLTLLYTHSHSPIYTLQSAYELHTLTLILLYTHTYRSTRAEYIKAEGFLGSAHELHTAFIARAGDGARVLSSPEQKQVVLQRERERQI